MSEKNNIVNEDEIGIRRKIDRRKLLQNKLYTVLRIYAVLGVLVSLISFANFVILKLDMDLTGAERSSLMLSGIGIFLSVASVLLIFIKKNIDYSKEKEVKQWGKLEYFLLRWTSFEAAGKTILLEKGYELNEYSIRDILNGLYKTELITAADLMKLEEALQIRSLLLHGEEDLPDDLINMVMENIEVIILKIQHEH